jgi:hypothetical protein
MVFSRWPRIEELRILHDMAAKRVASICTRPFVR